MTVQLRFEESLGGVRFAFTDRFGGVSRAPYAELNLGGHVGDTDDVVIENRRLLADRIGLPVDRVLYMNQVHGPEVAVANGPWDGAAPHADALVTRERDLALAVLVADCVPLVLADRGAGVIAVAHAGRPGLVAGIVPAVVKAMKERGARAIAARVGPSVCGGCYEVPETMRTEVAAALPEAFATTRQGTPSVDVAAGVEAQLRSAGVAYERVAGCTIEDHGLFSFRRDGKTGRFAGVAWLPS
ncbi:MAG TPA: peptidoglycan editing factor PgeF [Jiangellaceae bacterium]|nr:peptidoglycan editing factor PgeF [Jiangellaceae bacterium]